MPSPAHWLANAVSSHPWRVLLICLVTTLIGLGGLYDRKTQRWLLPIDPSVEQLMPVDDPDRQFYEYAQQAFGDDNNVLMVVSAPDHLFTPKMMNLIRELQRDFENLEHIQQVFSIESASIALGNEDDLEIDNIGSLIRNDPSKAEMILAGATSNPILRNTLISADGRVTALSIKLDDIDDRQFLKLDIAGNLRAVGEARIQASNLAGVQLWITGVPVIKAATSAALVREMERTLPLILALVAGFLLIAFRDLRAVLLAVTTIAIALAITLGLVGWLGRSLNLVTVLIPALIATLGLAYAMHLLSDLFISNQDHQRGKQEPNCFKKRLSGVGLPLLITGLSTAGGFLALSANPLAAIREFAWVTAFGVIATVLLCLTFLPAGMSVLQGKKAYVTPRAARRFDWIAFGLSRFVARYPKAILAAGAALGLAGIVGATQIQVGSNFISDFPEDSQVRFDYEQVAKNLGGANSFSVVIRGFYEDAFTRPEILSEVLSLQDWLAEQPEIGSTVSIVDHIRVIGKELVGIDEIPDQANQIKQLLVLGGNDALAYMVDSRFSVSQIQVRAIPDDSAKIAALIQRIEQRLSHLPEPLEAKVTGNVTLVTRTLENIIRGQVTSIGLALLIVYLIVTSLFTSFRVGLFAMLPNLLPVAIYFGALGFSGVTLNPTTSLIACLILGIAVDDTIHYIARFNAGLKQTADPQKATYKALKHVIRPVTFTTITLCLGFSVVAQSELNNQAQFGLLAACTLALAWLIDLTVTPALFNVVKVVTLWDLLRLDLGKEPQQAIPLFHGLTLRQARTFALMANVEQFRQGRSVIRAGDSENDMYVVIEGELDVWVFRDGKRVSLNRLGRGNTFGEVGYFSGNEKRSANVQALDNVHLLRFGAEDLKRLMRRRPIIAARVLHNLNRIQAKRVENVTRQLVAGQSQ